MVECLLAKEDVASSSLVSCSIIKEAAKTVGGGGGGLRDVRRAGDASADVSRHRRGAEGQVPHPPSRVRYEAEGRLRGGIQAPSRRAGGGPGRRGDAGPREQLHHLERQRLHLRLLRAGEVLRP